jgi:hypothetical protein
VVRADSATRSWVRVEPSSARRAELVAGGMGRLYLFLLFSEYLRILLLGVVQRRGDMKWRGVGERGTDISFVGGSKVGLALSCGRRSEPVTEEAGTRMRELIALRRFLAVFY